MGGVILDDSEPEIKRQQILFDIVKDYIPNLTMERLRKAWMDSSGTFGSMRIVALRELCKDLPESEEIEKQYNELCQVDYIGMSKVRPEVKEVLSKLSTRYNLGLMANQNAKAMEHLVNAGVLEFFSHQKMSHHVGLEKPNPEFFKSILGDTGAKAEESVIIDDNWFRGCLPAMKMGMKSILYERDIIPSPSEAQPDARVKNLTELLGIF